MRALSSLLALALALTACMPRKDGDGMLPPVAKPDAAHSSRNALDWAGVYEGVLPCADCPGIQTRLTLNRDETYELSTLYLERDNAARLVHGRFNWQPNGNAITLDDQRGGQQFMVGEGRLAILEAGAAPAWPQPPNRVLTLVATAADAGMQRTLESHRWTLTSATGAQGQRIDGLPVGAGRPIVLSFAQGRINIEGGCNRTFGGYQIEGGSRLKVGRMASTMMACEPAAMKIDSTLSELLAEPAKIELAPGAEPVLRLVTPANTSLSFKGQMTPEARYGPPTRVFLEVAAQTAVCNNPLSGANACIQVRERRFDTQGLVIGTPGAWQPFYDPIEGYMHQPGVRNVLRLKRFERGASAGGPTFVYVLDLVVESESVAR
jgi:heat shock protein HslJ